MSAPPVIHRVEISPRTLVYALLIIAGVYLAYLLEDVLIVITVALVLVGTLDPLVGWFERHGFGRGRALALIFLLVAGVIGVVIALTIPPLISQALHLLSDAPKWRDKIVEALHPYKMLKPLANAVRAAPVTNLVTNVAEYLAGYWTQLLTLVGYAISTTFLAIYLLADPMRARGLVYAVVPRHHHLKLARILLELKVIVGGYMRGQLITSVAISAFTFGLLTIFKVEDALALALFAGVTDIIPFVGGYIASAPVVAAVSGHGAGAMALVAAIMLAYQEFESRILVPRVYGRVLRLSPAIVLVSLLVGGTLLGVVGALLALPIAAGLQMVVRELRVELPGEAPRDEESRERDERAEQMYESITEGDSAADAAVVAGEIAEKMKQTERAGGLTAELVALSVEHEEPKD
ncbi:MAG TPA: AI-2E family transporter [Kofleriaceae bacterium]